MITGSYDGSVDSWRAGRVWRLRRKLKRDYFWVGGVDREYKYLFNMFSWSKKGILHIGPPLWMQRLDFKSFRLCFFKGEFCPPPLGQKHGRIFCRGKISKMFVSLEIKCQWKSDDFSTEFPKLFGYNFQLSRLNRREEYEELGNCHFFTFQLPSLPRKKILCSWICFLGVFF